MITQQIKIFCISFFLPAVLLLSGCLKDSGDDSAGDGSGISSARLVMDSDTVVSGGAIAGTLNIELAKGWHTYSDPPGDSGMAPIIDFKLPAGWTADVMPLPQSKRFETDQGTTFGYEGNLAIRFRLQTPDQLTVSEQETIGISLQWLVCRDTCVPFAEELTAVLRVAAPQKQGTR